MQNPKGRVLMVDDKKNDFEVFGQPLCDDYGWDVQYAPGPKEALHRLNAESFDVVIVDREMWDAETGQRHMEVGDELLEEITAGWSYVCPIMLTNHGNLDAAQRATKNGAFYYFVKDDVTVARLEAACRKGIQRQRVMLTRHRILTIDSEPQILVRTRESVRELFNPPGYCFAYLQINPGDSMRLGDYDGAEKDLGEPLAKAVNDSGRFLANCTAADWVRERRLFWLKTTKEQVRKSDSRLLLNPASQLIVPVLRPADSNTRKPNEVMALIWVESSDEDAFDKEDARTLCQLADYVGVALDRVRKLESHGIAERKSERDALMAEVAHRILNPLQITLTTLDLLQARIRLNDESGGIDRRDTLKKLSSGLRSIDQAIEAAKRLRELSELPEPRLIPLDLGSITQEVVHSFEPMTEAEYCEMEACIESRLPLVNLDAGEMRYVLSCLLQNALEAIRRNRDREAATPTKGRIRVVVATDPSKERSVVLSVEDNGTGIDRKDEPRIFDRFYSTKVDAFRGGEHGLGLWHTKQFVEFAKGEIYVDTDKGRGTTILIYFPAISE